jgi:arylsulfatase A-like enzyme
VTRDARVGRELEPVARARVSRARALLAGVVWLAPACSREPPPPDVVLLTIDTLRTDAVGAYRESSAQPSPTPFGDELARRGVLFEQCFAPRGQTQPSLASLLTGKFPAAHGLRRNGDRLALSNEPLPVLLKRRGYRTAAFVSALDRGRWDFWVRGFDATDDGTGGKLLERVRSPDGQRGFDAAVTEAAIRWLEALPRDDDAPIFLWVHVFDAHEPYTPDPALAVEYGAGTYAGPLASPRGAPPGIEVDAALRRFALGELELDAEDHAHVRALYDASVRGCDDKLAQVHAALRRLRGDRDTLLVYSADHGEDLGERKRYYGHGNSIHDTSLRVPLLLVRDGVLPPGRRVTALVQNVDVFATILAAAGAAIPQDSVGFDLLPLATGDPSDPATRGREHVFGEWEDAMTSASDGRFKRIANPLGIQPNNPPFESTPDRGMPYACHELYDLESDPLERVNLYARGEPHGARLADVIRAFRSDPRQRPSGGGSLGGDGGDDEALRALGYLGANSRGVPRIDCGEK